MCVYMYIHIHGPLKIHKNRNITDLKKVSPGFINIYIGGGVFLQIFYGFYGTQKEL